MKIYIEYPGPSKFQSPLTGLSFLFPKTFKTGSVGFFVSIPSNGSILPIWGVVRTKKITVPQRFNPL